MPPKRRLPWLAVLELPRDILAAMAITVSVAFGNGAIVSVLAPISRDFNLTDSAGTALAALIASFAFARLIINLPIGPWSTASACTRSSTPAGRWPSLASS